MLLLNIAWHSKYSWHALVRLEHELSHGVEPHLVRVRVGARSRVRVRVRVGVSLRVRIRVRVSGEGWGWSCVASPTETRPPVVSEK